MDEKTSAITYLDCALTSIYTAETFELNNIGRRYIAEHPPENGVIHVHNYLELSKNITNSVKSLFDRMQAFPFTDTKEIDKVEKVAKDLFYNYRTLFVDYFKHYYIPESDDLTKKSHSAEAEIFLGKATLIKILEAKKRERRTIYLSVLLGSALGILGAILGAVIS